MKKVNLLFLSLLPLFMALLFNCEFLSQENGACIDYDNNRCKEVSEGKCNTGKGLEFNEGKSCSDYDMEDEGENAKW